MKRLVVASGLAATLLMGCLTAEDLSSCSGATCSGHGSCVEDAFGPRCECDSGFTASGAQCFPVDPCSPNPCTGPQRTVCNFDGSAVACGCDLGFVERAGSCVPEDPCDPNPCDAPFTTACRAVGLTAICSCDDGYREDVLGSCVEACEPNPCRAPNQGVCSSAPGGYQCGCDEGFVFDAPGGGCFFDPPPDCGMAHLEGDYFEPDECPSLATLLVPPTSSTHSISEPGDEDWFAIDAVEGLVYLFETPPTGIVLELSARDSSNQTVLGSASSSSLSGAVALIVRPGPGRFFLRVKAADRWKTGTYSVLVETSPDDHGNSTAAATAVSLATEFAGVTEYPNDEDWFAIPATAGQPLQISLTGDGPLHATVQPAADAPPGPSACESTYGISQAAGTVTLGWKPTIDGTCYLRVRYFSGMGGLLHYTAVVEELISDLGDSAAAAAPVAIDTQLESALDYQSDVDWFTFTVPTSGVYRVRAQSFAGSIAAMLFTSSVLTNDQAQPVAYGEETRVLLTVELTGGQSYYLRLRRGGGPLPGGYFVLITDLGPDDFGDSAATSSPLQVGQPVSGRLQPPQDQDWFSVQLTPGRIYEARISAEYTVLGLYGVDGTTVLQASGQGQNPALRFCSWDAGPYFLSVGSPAPSNDSYSLVVTEVGSDDIGNSAIHSTAAIPDALVPGVLEYSRDDDWFSFQLESQHVYLVSLVPSNFTASLRLFATDASTLLGTGPTSTTESALLRRATTSGTYYVSVASADAGGGSGAYALRVMDLGPDDHGDGPTMATVVSAGGSREGSVQFPGDVDWLSLSCVEGHSCRVTVTPLGMTARARLIAPDGHNELGGQSSYSPIVFSFLAVTAEPFFVAVSAANATAVGSFMVQVEDLGSGP